MHTVSLTPPTARRRGFTLVEVLVVIAILSILIAFLVPAVLNGRRAALIVQVTTDITTLDNAIKSFKNEFGVEPPSQITLQPPGGTWDPNSRAIIGRLWPQFDFVTTSGGASWLSSPVTLNGAECLTFFLGGPIDNSSGTPTPLGFSRNPAQPFSTTGTNRMPPFVSFLPDRLIQSQSTTAEPDNDKFFSYSDPITGTKSPYLYASSNEGQGYNEATALPRTGLDFPASTLSYYYRQGIEPSEPTDPTSTAFTTPFWNKNGYQIISAGFDRKFGVGGPYAVKSGQKVLGLITGADRDAERDNITNFSNGLLVP